MSPPSSMSFSSFIQGQFFFVSFLYLIFNGLGERYEYFFSVGEYLHYNKSKNKGNANKTMQQIQVHNCNYIVKRTRKMREKEEKW